jgi:phosphoglycolate phosphatase
LSLILFDIDGTLLLSGGAGVRSMTRAFEILFDVPDGFAGIEVAGHTDTFLLSQALNRAGITDTRETHERFRDAYLRILAEEIRQPGSGRHGVMPGVESLLAAVRAAPRFHLGLLTGNYELAAQIKLTHFGLCDFFSWGAFGEESADRNELARLAMGRARERSVPEAACARATIVGDTPHDIACARAVGARAIAVATGSYSAADLQLAGADVVLSDLSNTTEVLELLV